MEIVTVAMKVDGGDGYGVVVVDVMALRIVADH